MFDLGGLSARSDGRTGVETGRPLAPCPLPSDVSGLWSFFAIVLALALTFALTSTPGLSQAQVPVAPPQIGLGDAIIADPVSGTALFGFDAVAYFAAGSAVPGNQRLTVTRFGLVWWFRNEGNRQAFAGSPDAYVPLYGGYDPLAIVAGQLVVGDPEIFAIVDDRLVLFRSTTARTAYLAGPDPARAAAARWPALSRSLVDARP